MQHPSDLTPLVLLIDDQEWKSRSIESILKPKGHVILKAYTGKQALDLVQRVSPDAFLVDMNLPDIHGIELVRELRAASTVQPMTPVLMITSDTVNRADRLAALEAGAWDVLTHPVDPNELTVRMETFVRAKQAADRLRDEGLTDPGTGFYNVRGIVRRAQELGADAVRFQRPLTCIAFGPQAFGDDPKSSEALAEAVGQGVASALRSVTRVSDTVGRLGPGEFIVVAPGTDPEGAVRLADRVFEAVERVAASEKLDPEQSKRIRAGFFSTRGDDHTTPDELLFRATSALRHAQADDGSFRVRAYEA
ncbi:MAG: response regulator [Gemmatimonadetes bacterium]|nr:response regulator [Gemmatimonadota bacterium]NNF13893.1 response regulator [Gemmatimonadota bacterium]NNL31121.1 response regulator [Gemmatimonadota bacterium]